MIKAHQKQLEEIQIELQAAKSQVKALSKLILEKGEAIKKEIGLAR